MGVTVSAFSLSERTWFGRQVVEARLPIAGEADLLVRVSKSDQSAWVGVEHAVHKLQTGRLDRDQAKAAACLLLTFARTGAMPETPEDDYVLYADVGDVIARLTRERDEAQQEVAALTERIHELESPPVVPEGCTVRRCLDDDGKSYWDLFAGPVENDDDLVWAKERLAGYRALVWAIEHDQRPPHAGEVTP